MVESEYCICMNKCSTRATAKKCGLDIDALPCKGDYTTCPTYIYKGHVLAQITGLESEVIKLLEQRGID